MERKLPGKISRKSGYTSGGCPILGFHLLMEVAREAQAYFFGGREGTTGNTSALRRLYWKLAKIQTGSLG